MALYRYVSDKFGDIPENLIYDECKELQSKIRSRGPEFATVKIWFDTLTGCWLDGENDTICEPIKKNSDVWQHGKKDSNGNFVGVLISIPDDLTAKKIAQIRKEFAERFPAVWVRCGTRPADGHGLAFAAMGVNAEAVRSEISAHFDGWQ